MSYSITISGHVQGDAETAAKDEAQLAVDLHQVLTTAQYGCTNATLTGQHIGTVDLLAASDGDDQPDVIA